MKINKNHEANTGFTASLEFDFRFLNLFNIFFGLKKAVFSKCSTPKYKNDPKMDPRKMFEEFELMFVDNLKILTYKAFRKGSKITDRYCRLINDAFRVNKYANKNKDSIGPIAEGLSECINEHLSSLLELNKLDQPTKRKDYEAEFESLDSLRVLRCKDLIINNTMEDSEGTTTVNYLSSERNKDTNGMIGETNKFGESLT